MKVLYFAWLKEKTSLAQEELTLPTGVNDVEGLIDFLKNRGGGFSDAFADPAMVRVAVNMEHVQTSHPLNDSDEIAFFPPITGG